MQKVTANGRNDLTNRKFGRLLVKEYDISTGKWLCLCDCGNEIYIYSAYLTRKRYTQSCGCYRKDKTSETNHTYKKYKDDLAAKLAVLHEYKRSAKRREKEFDLEVDYFIELISSPCHYCNSIGTNLKRISRTNEIFYYNGIDRRDNAQGYIVGNVVTCCSQCNKSKGTLSEKEFLEWIQRVAKVSIHGSHHRIY